MRIQDHGTGAKATVGAELAELLVGRGAATVLDEPAVDAVFGTPLPAEPAPPTAKATKTSTTTGKQGDH